MTRHWGPVALGDGRARFRLWAPDVAAVMLERDGADAIAMTRSDDGWFTADAAADRDTRYRFRLPSGLTVPDPASRRQSGGVHGWSVIDDPTGYDWHAPGWRGRPWREAVIQEVQVGVLGGFAGVMAELDRIAAIGVTAIELMPIAAFAGARNWGYDGVLPYAVAEGYGTPDDLRALVDAAHARGMMVLLDVVYNHFGPDGNYLGSYAGDFFDRQTDTPWGAAVAVSRAPVARFFIDNALMWIGDYRFDGLRFDAVHAIADDAFLDDMAHAVRAAFPDRHVHLVLENERNDAARLTPATYDAQWNDDFHNVLHVLLTGETMGYYADFADHPTQRLARCLAQGFVYQGEGSPNHGGTPRGTPSADLPPTAFVAFLQNHDQIGNRALGERLTTLVAPERLRAAIALLLLCPQIPLIFMGDETGSRAPFQFFTDFADDLADAVREGRRHEFANFPAFADPAARAAIPDPNDRATFDRSRPTPGPDAAAWQDLYRDLLAIRGAQIVPRLDDARSAGVEVLGQGAVMARWWLGEAILSIAINLGDAPVAAAPIEGVVLWQQGQPGTPASIRVTMTHD